MDARVCQVISRMKGCLNQAPPLADLARAVNLSPSRLNALFKEETGLPPAKYLRLLRLHEARRLLETTFLSVKQVMARVGVADESHFVRDFRKAFGMTPARYREHFLVRRADSGGGVRKAAPSSVPPLLVRRPSHPSQLADGRATHRRGPTAPRELPTLLALRHNSFAEITSEISREIAEAMLCSPRALRHQPRPRPSVARRPPPAAVRPIRGRR